MGRTTAIALLAIAVAIGCRTAPEPSPYLIPLPAGITAQQTDIAVLAGILNKPPPPDYDPTREMSAKDFNSFVWQKFVGTANNRSWFPEKREGTTIYASVTKGDLYLRAAIERQPGALRIAIVESRGLSQEDGHIHKRAISWLDNLDAHIRREVARMATLLHLSI